MRKVEYVACDRSVEEMYRREKDIDGCDVVAHGPDNGMVFVVDWDNRNGIDDDDDDDELTFFCRGEEEIILFFEQRRDCCCSIVRRMVALADDNRPPLMVKLTQCCRGATFRLLTSLGLNERRGVSSTKLCFDASTSYYFPMGGSWSWSYRYRDCNIVPTEKQKQKAKGKRQKICGGDDDGATHRRRTTDDGRALLPVGGNTRN